MKRIEDVCIIIQARLGSQRVPNKMLKPFAESTLTDIALEKVKKCKSFPLSNFHLAVYEEELTYVGEKHGVNVFARSRKSAQSEGSPIGMMYEWWNKLPYTYAVLINACAPFLSPQTIDNFVSKYLDIEADGLFGVIEKKNYFWDQTGKMITKWPEGQEVMNTKFVEPTYEAAHCLYAGRMSDIGKGIWMGTFQKKGDPELFPMEEMETFDIDYPWQFDAYEKLYRAWKKEA